jgi:tRNA threonylcarbamoyladenosine biosynthesis protein TsaB
LFALSPDPLVGYAAAMTVTLCIETSTAHCSLALAVGDRVFSDHERLLRRHNEQVLPMLDGLYKQANIAPTETQLIGFGAGPGSFTGVRIAASITQGIALASGSQVVPLAGSEILLRSAMGAGLVTTGPWVTVVPSRADAFYLALYDVDDGAGLSSRVEDCLYTHPPDWLSEVSIPGQVLHGLGPQPRWLAEGVRFDSNCEVELSALAMVDITRHAHDQGRSKSPEQALPIYVEGDSPWRKVASNLGR